LFTWDFLPVVLPQVPSNGTVKAVLDEIIVATIKVLRNQRPFISKLPLKLKNFNLVLQSETFLVKTRIQVIMPPFSALFSSFIRIRELFIDESRDIAPLLFAIFSDKLHQSLVFLLLNYFRSPRKFI
jgi:hypothetical protein